MEHASPLVRLWRLAASEKAEIRNIYIFSIFQGLVNLSLPLGIQAIINLLQAGQLRTSWIVLVIFVLLGILFYGLLQLRLLRITESIEQRIFVKSSFEFAFRLPRIKTSSIKGKYVPEMMNRFFEVMTIQKSFSKLLIDLSSAVVQILFGLILLSFYHPLFILLGIALVVLLAIIFRVTGPSGMSSSLKESTEKFAVAHWLEEVGRTLMTFKLSGESDLPLHKTDVHTTGYLDARKKHFKVLMWQYKVLIFFKLAVAASLIIAGSVLVVQGQINIGQFVASEIIILLVINSVEKIILNMSTIYDLLTALDKVGHITDMPLERDNGNNVCNDPDGKGLHIKITDLTFQFSDALHPVLKNVNCEIKAGEHVCLTGLNGSGKTTLLKLISGFFAEYDGSIVINQVPIENIHLSSLRAAIGENFTEQSIFRGTIIENITCHRPGISIKEAVDATHAVLLNEYIESLPDGYETVLDPEGKRLATGIIRKIVLARSLINKPRLLLMEDNLNIFLAEEREKILNAIFSSAPLATIIIISNDLDIQKRCDRLIYL
jgi:ABC-type bacteriocin/lantibiotic exporter with double-glycine peptidase domain